MFWTLNVLKYSLPILNTFFSPLFSFLCKTVDCKNAQNNSGFPCISEHYQVQILISIISIFILIFVCFLKETFYHKSNFIKEENDAIKKESSISCRIFLFYKILVVICFLLENEDENYHWLLLAFLIFITGINAYFTNFYRIYANKILNRLTQFFSIALLWGYITLLVGKIFLLTGYNGSFYLFFLGVIIIALIKFYILDKNINFAMIDFDKIISSKECIMYIKHYLYLIENKEKCRDNPFILIALIERIETGCVNNNCPLKKYLNSLDNGIDSNFLLLQFAEILYEKSIRKFPKDIDLKINYILFLLTEENKKKRAQKELASIKSSFLYLENNFNIFRVSKYIEKYDIKYNPKDDEIINKDILLGLEYKNYSVKFKNLLNKVSNLYHEFWYLIFGSHAQGMEDFRKLNDIGTEIHNLIEQVEKSFETLYKINNNDPKMLKLYLRFAKDILNDNEKIEKYQNTKINMEIEEVDNVNNIDYTNFDMKILNKTDENQFLIISANTNNLGTIYNMSLNLCTLFGYNKFEVIGKNINIFIPELFQKSHDKILLQYTEQIKTKFYENFSHKTTYFPESKELFVYSRNKSKYLIPILLKIHFVLTEENENVYVIEVSGIDSQSIINSNYLISDDNEYTCCLITDNNLFIQSFTPNSMKILGLNSKVINSNYEITQFIKEFKEELYSLICPENNDYFGLEINDSLSSKTPYCEKNKLNNFNLEDYLATMPIEKKLQYKRMLIKKKYNFNRKITWVNMLNISKELKVNNSNIMNVDSYINSINSNYRNSSSKNNINKNILIKEEIFYMIVKEIKMQNEEIGFRFLLKVINKELKSKKDVLVKFTNHYSSINTSKGKKNLLKSGINTNKNKKYSIDVTNNNNIINKFEDELPSLCINDLNLECNFNFYLDMDKMSYKPNYNKNLKENIFIESLKSRALEKIKIFQNNMNEEKKKNDSYNSNSSYSDVEEYEEYEGTNSSNSASKEQSRIINTIISNKMNESNKYIKQHKSSSKKNNSNFIRNKLPRHISNINDFENDFYKVNIDKIRFMIFDFQKEMIIDSNYGKISQVEKILNNNNNESFNNYLSEDKNYLSSKNFNFIGLEKSPNKISSNKIDIIKNNKNNEKLKNCINSNYTFEINKKKEFEKEITDTLDKNDSQSVVSFFSITSIIMFLLILGISIFEIYFIKIHSSNLKKLYNLIINAINLRYRVSYSIYYMRELTLLNMNITGVINGTYEGMPAKNKILYSSSIKQMIKTIYHQGHTSISEIIGTDVTFSNELNNGLNVEPYTMIFLLPNYELKSIISSLANSMIQLFASFYGLCSSFLPIQQNQDDLYNFLYNALNSMNRGLKTQVILIKNEFLINCKRSLKFIIVILIAFLIIYIFCYFITIISFSYISKKKISYITVFFGIGLSMIKSSITKCEKFINEFSNDNGYISVSEEFNQNEDGESLSSSRIKSQLLSEDFSINCDYKVKNKYNNKKIKNDSTFINFRIMLIIIIFFSFIFIAFIIFLYFKLINNLLVYGEYGYRMQKLPNNIIELFNTYREFLFDNESIILDENCLDHLKNLENETYSEKPNDSAYLSKNFAKLGEDLNQFFDGFNSSCALMNNYYFSNWSDCTEYYGPIDLRSYQTLMTYFIDEIRTARNLVSLLLDQNKIVGNLTRYGSNNYSSLNLTENSSLIFRLELFNMNDTHKELNLFFSNIIMPYLEEERNMTLNEIQRKINGQEKSLYILIAVHIIIIVAIIFVYWIPMIKWTNIDLYKTKNMLSIIPVQILSAQPDIKILLNIKDKNN